MGDGLRHRARLFADRYATAHSEKQLAQSFWRDFFIDVLEIPDLLVAGIEFEVPVRSSEGTVKFIDCLWTRTVLIEHKSTGKDLNVAEAQARDYLAALPHGKRPSIIVVSDFQRFRIIDTIRNETLDFPLTALPDNIERFTHIIEFDGIGAAAPHVEADRKAVELMGGLFTAFDTTGYEGHQLSVFLIRILFLNFGDDTGMWKQAPGGLFGSYITNTYEDGSGLGGRIQELFQILDTPEDKRPSSLSPALADFPYINGGLFSEQLPIFAFTPEMRAALIATTVYDWSNISPAIFGAMFQTVKNKELRRESGEFYTSEQAILRVISPLFLDELNIRLEKAWTSKTELKKLWSDLGKSNYLDPAAGSGNFLLVSYKKLRELEVKLIARLNELEGRSTFIQIDGSMGLQVHLNQFHGIELDEWSSQIAYVAMFLADQQANREMETILGVAPNRFPLTESAVIRQGNALDIDWSTVCPMNTHTIIMGNPPFIGANQLSKEQKTQTIAIWGNAPGTGLLDYVSNWFLIASRLSAQYGVKVAFVATNSITQGEQPATIWSQLLPLGIGIDFAYRTFWWDNGAAVHVVIIGFSAGPKPEKRKLWSFEDIKGEPTLSYAKNINAYLIDGPDVIIGRRSKPLVSSMEIMAKGNMPTDNGLLSNISEEEASEIRQNDPIAAKYLRKVVGAKELIQGEIRYCLWLVNVDPSEIRNSPEISRRVAMVREFRLASIDKTTRADASRAWEFQRIRQPNHDYIAVPSVSSENREYVPMAMFSQEVIDTNLVFHIANGGLRTFGFLMSQPFNIWNKTISGRLKSDTRISNTITYNNFPFPETTPEQDAAIEKAASEVLTARAEYPTSSLSDLYNSTFMPTNLRRAHTHLDKVILATFGLPTTATDEQILSALFTRYATLTQEIFPPTSSTE
jgi:hypothetical protein